MLLLWSLKDKSSPTLNTTMFTITWQRKYNPPGAAYKSLYDLTPPSLTFITFGPEIHTGRVVLYLWFFLAPTMLFYITVPLLILFPLIGLHFPLFYLPYYVSFIISVVTPHQILSLITQVRLSTFLCPHRSPVTPVKFNIFFLKLHFCFWLWWSR